MGSESLQERVRRIIERYSEGTTPHGLQIELLRVEDGVAHLRMERLVTEHQCGECDVQIPMALNYLMQDLRGLKGLDHVEAQ
ncbi:MAG: hypothetical protein ACE5I4_07675 [Thermoplasmata archaeon]